MSSVSSRASGMPPELELLKDPGISPEGVMEVIRNLSCSSRLTLASNPEVPSRVLRILTRFVADNYYSYYRDREYGEELLKTALENPQVTPEIFMELARHWNEFARFVVAESLCTPVEVLCFLAKDLNYGVRLRVASHPRIPVEQLTALARDESPSVRASAAGNPSLPSELLIDLADDRVCDVRKAVAGNPQTPIEVLRRLSKDEESIVRAFVASNSKTPPDILISLTQDKSKTVLYFLAENPKAPLEVLQRLLQNPDPYVFSRVLCNPALPLDLLSELVKTLHPMDDGDIQLMSRVFSSRSLDELCELASKADKKMAEFMAEIHKESPFPIQVLHAGIHGTQSEIFSKSLEEMSSLSLMEQIINSFLAKNDGCQDSPNSL